MMEEIILSGMQINLYRLCTEFDTDAGTEFSAEFDAEFCTEFGAGGR